MIGDRIRQARAALKLSQEEAAEAAKIPLGSVRKYEQGSSKPGSDALASLSTLGINANWLLTGEGPMLVANLNASGEPSADYVAVPLYDGVRAAADHGALVEHEMAERSVNFSATWLRSTFGARPKDLCMINVTGDSMEPTLRAGDVLLIDCRVLRPDREGIYVVRINDAILVKRVQVLPGGVFRFTSDNPAFQPFNVTPEDESNAPVIIGRALWSGRLL